MNNGEKKAGSGFLGFLERKTVLPGDALVGEFRLEVRGRRTLFMQGCRRILKYSPEEMVLGANGFKVTVLGSGLICSTYHDGTVTVEGEILSVDLGGGENR